MKDIRHVFSDRAIRSGLNSIMTQDDIRALKQDITETVLPNLRGREFLPILTVEKSAEFFGFWLETQMQDAIIGGRRTSALTKDELKETLQTLVPIPMLRRPFEIYTTDLFAKSNAKERSAKSAARQVSEGENDLIYNGATYPVVNGLLGAAGNSQAASSVWSAVPGTAIPYEDSNNLIALNEADGFMGPYIMAVDPINLGEMRKREVVAGGSARSQLELILAGLPIQKVIGDPSMTHGTPIIMQPGDQNSCLVVAEDITVEFFDMNIDHWIQGQVYERVAPAVFQANSVGKITGA